MFSCCSLPTESLRLLVVAALLLVEIVWVTKKNRRAALIMAAGTTLDLGSSVAVPLLEIAGLTLITNNPGDMGVAGVMLGMFVVPMLGRLTIALHLLALLVGISMLIADLPDEERPDW